MADALFAVLSTLPMDKLMQREFNASQENESILTAELKCINPTSVTRLRDRIKIPAKMILLDNINWMT